MSKNNSWSGFKKIMIFFNQKICFIYFILFFLNLVYRHLYIDVYIYKLFQTCSIQIDLGTCLNRGYLIFAYIKTLGNVHKASPPVVLNFDAMFAKCSLNLSTIMFACVVAVDLVCLG